VPDHAVQDVVARPHALLAGLRLRQWIKNLLVVTAPLAAGVLDQRDVVLRTLLAFVCFCACASAVYLLNDVVDAEADRRHPVKRFRPVASGALRPATALTTAAVLAVAALSASWALGTGGLAVVLASYLAASAWYCLQAKHIAVVELAVVASGFVLRAAAGGIAAGLPISRWFLIVASFGSLLVASGKRYSELVGAPPDDAPDLDLDAPAARVTRPVLAAYTPQYLRFVWTMSAAVCATAYCLWAFEVAETAGGTPWAALSVAPFVVALLRYALDVDHGRAQEPERIVLTDRVLQALALAWVVTFAVGAVHA